MENGWEGLVNSGKIRENTGNCGELEIQHKQDFWSVETNKILGWPTNMHPLTKSGPELSSLQPLIHHLLLQRRDTKTPRGSDLPKVTQFIIRPGIQTSWFPLNILKWHSQSWLGWGRWFPGNLLLLRPFHLLIQPNTPSVNCHYSLTWCFFPHWVSSSHNVFNVFQLQ